MPDLKINGTTYAGVEKVQIPLSDNSGNAVFVDEGTVVNGTLLFTPESDMTVKDIVAAHPIPRKYEKSLVWIKITGDNIASQGSETINWLIVYCNNAGTPINERRFLAYMYANGLGSPDNIGLNGTIYSKNENYIGLGTDGTITGLDVNSYVAAGNSISYLEIPFDYDNFLFTPFS